MDQVCNGSSAPQGYLPVPTADPPPAYSASTGPSFVAQPQSYQPLSSSQQNSSVRKVSYIIYLQYKECVDSCHFIFLSLSLFLSLECCCC